MLALDAIARHRLDGRINAKHTYWVAQAKLAAGRAQDGMAVLRATLNNTSGAMFRVWALADTYGRWAHEMSEQMQASAEFQLVRYGSYNGGSTVNHRLMYATARYLAEGFFPAAEFRSDFRPADPSGRAFLLASMDRLARLGIDEFDSPNYTALYVGVAQSLADLAPDADVRSAAGRALDSMLLSAGGEWLDGHRLSGSLRDKRAADGQFDFQGGDYVLWLYSGGGATPDFSPAAIAEEGGLAHLVVHLIGARKAPIGKLEQIGRQRTQRSYTHLDTDLWGARRFWQTAFINRSYGIYSTIESYPIHSGYSRQFHRWGVRWLSPRKVSSFWLKHPHRQSGIEGTTGYEQVVQCGGALAGIYDVPATYPVQHIGGSAPGRAKAAIDESRAGRLYLHYGSVLVALRASSGFSWDREQGSLRLADPRAGFVVETARPSEYSGNPKQRLRAFKREVASLRLAVTPGERVAYTSRSGALIAVSANGDRRIDGEALDLSAWPLVSDPWVEQALGSAVAGPGAGWQRGLCAESRAVARCAGRPARPGEGSARGERLRGSGSRDRLRGRGGADRLIGRGRSDCLLGMAGNDRLSGGTGADRLLGGTGNDVLAGRAGDDRLTGGRGKDVLRGGPGRDEIFGGRGRDRIEAADGRRDRVDCGQGRDIAIVDRSDRVRNCERVRVRRR